LFDHVGGASTESATFDLKEFEADERREVAAGNVVGGVG